MGRRLEFRNPSQTLRRQRDGGMRQFICEGSKSGPSLERSLTGPEAISRLVDSSTIVEPKGILLIPSEPIDSVSMTENVLIVLCIIVF